MVATGTLVRGFIETAASMEKMRLMLVGLTGSAIEAQKSMEWIQEFAGRAPYDLNALSNTFVKLRVAGLDPTTGSMQALVDAVAAFGGSNEQLNRASVAIQQMAGKGVVSMEELRQQLGEAVPDAIKVMASEMKMSIRDLTDIVSKGNLDAATGLTALFEGWAKKHAGAAEKFANSMSGLWNQIRLQYELFKHDMMTSGDSFITIKAALKTVLDLIKKWREDNSLEEWSNKAASSLMVVVDATHILGKAFLGWKVIWAGLKESFKSLAAYLYETYAWMMDKTGILYEKIAGLQKLLNFDAAADKTRLAAASMRDWGVEASKTASVWREEGVTALEDSVSAVIKFDAAHKKLKETFYANVEAMKEQAEISKVTAEVMQEGTEENIASQKELTSKILDLHKIELAAMDEIQRELTLIEEKYQEMHSALDKWLSAEKVGAEEAARLHRDLRQRETEEYEDFWSTNKQINDEGNDTLIDTWTHTYERFQDIVADWMYNLKFNFDDILNMFKRMVAQMVAAWIFGTQAMSAAFGGGGGGAGGFNMSSLFSFGGGGSGGGSIFGMPGNMTSGAFDWFAGILQDAGYGSMGLHAGISNFGQMIAPYASAFGWGALGYSTLGKWLGLPQSKWSGLTAGGGAAAGLAIGGPIGAFVGGVLGGVFGGLFGGNKKRSYLERYYTFGDYSTASGWGAPGMEETFEKRSGEDFRESADAMAETGMELLNAFDSFFKSTLGYFGDDYVWEYQKKMQELAKQGLEFRFRIGAEDKKEFEEDWVRSWSAMMEAVIQPVVDIGGEMLKEAMEGAVSDSSVWNYLTDEMKTYLTDSIEDSLDLLDIDWSKITSEEELMAALEQMELGAEQMQEIVEYFKTIGSVLATITEIVELSGTSEGFKQAASDLLTIYSTFEGYKATLEEAGIDLDKYTDLQKAYYISLQDSIYAMSQAQISGEDLAGALDYLAEKMEENGATAEEVANMYRVATAGLIESINSLWTRKEMFGKTVPEYLSEKYPGADFTQWTFNEFAAWWQGLYQDFLDQQSTGYSDFISYLEAIGYTPEMIQDIYLLGNYLELIWEEEQTTNAKLDDQTDALTSAMEKEARDHQNELERIYEQAARISDSISALKDELIAESGVYRPEQQYAYAQQELGATLEAIKAGEPNVWSTASISEYLALFEAIPEQARAFLEASRSYSTSYQQYTQDVNQVMAMLNWAEAQQAAFMAHVRHAKYEPNPYHVGIGDGEATGGGAGGGRHPWESAYMPYRAPMWHAGMVRPAGVETYQDWVDWLRQYYPGHYSLPENAGYTMQTGGTISGPDRGYTVPVTFHGTEHVTSDNQMGEVKKELAGIKTVLVMIMNTEGDINKNSKRMRDTIEKWDIDTGSLTVTTS
jgi:tape measure domain-containing protein